MKSITNCIITILLSVSTLQGMDPKETAKSSEYNVAPIYQAKYLLNKDNKYECICGTVCNIYLYLKEHIVWKHATYNENMNVVYQCPCGHWLNAMDLFIEHISNHKRSLADASSEHIPLHTNDGLPFMPGFSITVLLTPEDSNMLSLPTAIPQVRSPLVNNFVPLKTEKLVITEYGIFDSEVKTNETEKS